MTYDLIHFHFNPVKTGQIIKQLCNDRGMSMASLAKKTGITYDTMDNIFRGRVDVKFEQLFKVCCVLGLPIEALLLTMLKDEDVDFRDQILLYDNREDEAIPATNLDVVPSVVPDTVIAAAEAVAAAEVLPEPARKPAENPDNVVQLHRHIEKLMDLLEKAIERG